VGLRNFVHVFTRSPLQTATFWTLFGRTILWTFVNVFFHVVLGVGLALLLNRGLRWRGIYRTLLILPWAMPQVVAVLAWRGEFHPQFGVINQLLNMIGLPATLAAWLSLQKLVRPVATLTTAGEPAHPVLATVQLLGVNVAVTAQFAATACFCA